jgi:hypothetical protein
MKYLISSLVIIVIFLVAGLSYYVGRSSVGTNNRAATATGFPDINVSPTATVTPTPFPGRIITGGGILSFPKYEISVQQNWKDSMESQNKDNEKLILTNGEYKITITQGGFGGAVCLFPGDADVEGPSARYENYKEIKTESGDQLRRAWTGSELESKGFGICQNTEYGWGTPTLYGHISYTTPSSPDPAKLTEMDSILASITRI